MRLLIVDDEPLVQAGIKSMINWEEHGVSIVGTASNGAAAYEMIVKYEPEIVITDIKMPVMSGLELAQKCRDEGRSLPVFLFLTSFEEFSFVRQALSVQAVDYLIKLELTPQTLTEALKKAMDKAKSLAAPSRRDSSPDSLQLLQDQFYTRLILNLFSSEQQLLAQAANLGLDFSSRLFCACYLEIVGDKLDSLERRQRLNLYISTLQLVRELAARYLPCHVLSIDTRHFAILFFLDGEAAQNARQRIRETVQQVSAMLYNYYSVCLFACAGSLVDRPVLIASSYQEARQAFSQVSREQPFLFTEDAVLDVSAKNMFNISLFKEDIRRAYAEFDEKALHDIFTSIIDLFSDKPTYGLQAMDAAGNILYLSLSLLADGESVISDIFRDRPNGYRSLYELSRVDQIMDWLAVLRDGLCRSFSSHNRDYKHHVVTNVKKYISAHVTEKLTLNKVAEVFSISPNYLSILFSKYSDVGFNDSINQSKIDAAKKMLRGGEMKIYEISDVLGFESAFYFSRVFKRLEGVSPRDYMNHCLQADLPANKEEEF
ncbi:MAG: response regulator [Eubacteriales bacterium]|nr:response regulator [Eubacteriales bacterium]